jgi:hypothetical protein
MEAKQEHVMIVGGVEGVKEGYVKREASKLCSKVITAAFHFMMSGSVSSRITIIIIIFALPH